MSIESDKRNFPRLPLDVEVNYSGKGIARSKDVSEGGIRILTDEPMELSKICTLVFHIPTTGEKIQCFGKVVWTEQVSDHLHENGINFWDIDVASRQKISNYFKEQGPSL